MIANPPIMLVDKSTAKDDKRSCGSGSLDFDIDILGQKLNLTVIVAHKQARLSDIVPLAQSLSNKITNLVIESMCSDGSCIPCTKGCSDCCHYLLPVSVPEIFYLREEILTGHLPQQKLLLRSCLLAAKNFLKHKPPGWLVNTDSTASPDTPVSLDLLSNWYSGLNVPCPFLCKSECIIYNQRPFGCREHFVKGSPRACKSRCGTAEVAQVPIQMSEVLAKLAASIEGTDIETVMMPLAMVWSEMNLFRHKRTWPTTALIKCFIEIVRSMVLKNSETVMGYA